MIVWVFLYLKGMKVYVLWIEDKESYMWMLYIINIEDDLIVNYMNILEFILVDFIGNFRDEGIFISFNCMFLWDYLVWNLEC